MQKHKYTDRLEEIRWEFGVVKSTFIEMQKVFRYSEFTNEQAIAAIEISEDLLQDIKVAREKLQEINRQAQARVNTR